MTDLIPNKRYKATVEGVSTDRGTYLNIDGLWISVELLKGIELLPDPLPTGNRSVVLDRFNDVWQLRARRWWHAGSDVCQVSDGPFIAEYGPFTVLFDAGKSNG